MPQAVSSRRRCCARVKRVDVALGRAARAQSLALVYRKVAAVLEIDSYPDDVHANRIIRIIRLRLGRRGRRNHPHRQNRQSKHAYQNLLPDRRHSTNAPKQTNHIDLSQFLFCCHAIISTPTTVAALMRSLRRTWCGRAPMYHIGPREADQAQGRVAASKNQRQINSISDPG